MLVFEGLYNVFIVSICIFRWSRFRSLVWRLSRHAWAVAEVASIGVVVDVGIEVDVDWIGAVVAVAKGPEEVRIVRLVAIVVESALDTLYIYHMPMLEIVWTVQSQHKWPHTYFITILCAYSMPSWTEVICFLKGFVLAIVFPWASRYLSINIHDTSSIINTSIDDRIINHQYHQLMIHQLMIVSSIAYIKYHQYLRGAGGGELMAACSWSPLHLSWYLPGKTKCPLHS